MCSFNAGTGSLCRWSSSAVTLLHETYKVIEDVISRGKLSQKQSWNKISVEYIKKWDQVTGPIWSQENKKSDDKSINGSDCIK